MRTLEVPYLEVFFKTDGFSLDH